MLHEEAKDRFIGDDPDIIFDCEENTAHGVKPACRALKDALREADERYDDQIFIQDGYTTFIGIDDYHARSFVRHLESGSIRLELMRDL